MGCFSAGLRVERCTVKSMKTSLGCHWAITAVFSEDSGQGLAASRVWSAYRREEPRTRGQVIPAEASWVSRLYS